MGKLSLTAGAVALTTAAAVALATAPAQAVPVAPGSIVRVDSVAQGGVPAQGAEPAGISANGRYVLWSTPNPTVAFAHLYYLTDTTTGTSQLVTKDLSGNPLTQDVSNAVLSSNGRYVAYATTAPGLPHPGRPGLANDSEVYRYDSQTGDVRAESLTANNTRPRGSAGDIDISATGRFVVYTSTATDLPGGYYRHRPQVYLFDNQTHETSHISLTLQGLPVKDNTFSPHVSSDGRFVTYTTGARDVTTSTTCHCTAQVYLVDRQAPGNGTTLVSHSATRGVKGGAFGGELSADGSTVVYGMGSFGTPAGQQVRYYRYDVATGKRLLINDIALPGTTFWSGYGGPSVSSDGRYVAYALEQGINSQPHVLRYDATTRTTEAVYSPGAAVPATPVQFGATLISGDGRHIAFDDAVPPISDPADTNGVPDVYEWNAGPPH